jgi:peptide/nickel transport system permease protein
MNLLKDLLKRDTRFRTGFVLLMIIVFLVILSFFSPYDPYTSYYVRANRPPNLKNIFGTTSRGQDVFWMMTFSLRNSLSFCLITAAISRVIAILFGALAGYIGGKTDKFLMTINDSFITLPVLLIIMLIGMIMHQLSMFSLALLLALFGWPWDARLFRSQILNLKERKLTYTARFSGMNTLKIIFKIYLPHLTPIFVTTFINNMIWSIGLEVTLSVLGLTDIRTPTIGTSIYWANQHQAMILGIWWWLLAPVFIAILLFTSLYLISISLNEYIDPRVRYQVGGSSV